MNRGGRPLDPVFEAVEALYRRCHPDHIDEYEEGKFRVLPVAWSDLHSMSVVRQKYAQPDHARWDSATDPENPAGFEPRLYRDWYVVGVPVAEIPQPIATTGGVTYSFAPAHVPFDDLYSHSEIQASKDGARILKQNKFKNDDVKLQYRGILSNKAVVVLKPEHVEIPAPPAP
jgi:hypothetical protein